LRQFNFQIVKQILLGALLSLNLTGQTPYRPTAPTDYRRA
jgi:hypothetical protein